MIPGEFDYFSPHTLDEAITLLETYGTEAKVLAGGVDILRNLKYKVNIEQLKYIVGLKSISGLNSIERTRDGIKIGSMTLLSSLEDSGKIKGNFGLLRQAANRIGTPQLRNQITVGGNLCQDLKCWHYNLTGISQFMRKAHEPFCWRKNRSSSCISVGEDDVYHSVVNIGQKCWASSPSDMAVVLGALNAKAIIVSKKSEKQLSVEDLYSNNGDCILESNEIITEILVPNIPEDASAVYFTDKRSTMDLSLVCIAMIARLDSAKHKFRYVKATIGGIAPKPISFEKTFDNAGIDQVKQDIKKDLLAKVLVRGPDTEFKVNEAKVFIKDALELIKVGGVS
ncbi:MAG: FAD binding domain-containing protein [Candidatus Hodarchaeota archaeon]